MFQNVTTAEIDKTIDWDVFSWWGKYPKGAVVMTAAGTVVIHDFQGRCDHETCYETHGTRLVFTLGDRYFLKEGTYDSQDGFQWNVPLKQVKPVTKTVEAFEDVPEYVWDEAGISSFLLKWFKEQPSSRYNSYDWTNLFYAAAKEPFQPAGFPYPIKGVEEYMPGEADCTGPVWLIFEINGEQYAAKGRNVSHVGWDFDGVYALEKVEKKTVTLEVWQ